MRMWMVEPRNMCRQHLLGAHVELHMLLGHLNRGRSIGGFVAKNCTEPAAMNTRHEQLVAEITSRGYKHASPLKAPTWPAYDAIRVDRAAAQAELVHRCAACAAKFSQS